MKIKPKNEPTVCFFYVLFHCSVAYKGKTSFFQMKDGCLKCRSGEQNKHNANPSETSAIV